MAEQSWKIHFSKKAARYIQNLRSPDKARIKSKIDELIENPQAGYPLHGELKSFYRIRIGDIRIIYKINVQAESIDIVEIGPRGDIYK